MKGKIWTNTPSSVSFEKTYTRLSWVKKNRVPYGLETEDMIDVTEIFKEMELAQIGPVRILIQGN